MNSQAHNASGTLFLPFNKILRTKLEGVRLPSSEWSKSHTDLWTFYYSRSKTTQLNYSLLFMTPASPAMLQLTSLAFFVEAQH